jgi:hypothetical protein
LAVARSLDPCPLAVARPRLHWRGGEWDVSCGGLGRGPERLPAPWERPCGVGGGGGDVSFSFFGGGPGQLPAPIGFPCSWAWIPRTKQCDKRVSIPTRECDKRGTMPTRECDKGVSIRNIRTNVLLYLCSGIGNVAYSSLGAHPKMRTS